MMPLIIATVSSSFVREAAATAAAYRYWRLTFQDGATTIYCSLAEVEFRAVAAGPSIATGGTAFGTADRGGSWAKANAFDGDNSTFYSVNRGYPSIELGYDFGSGNQVVVSEIMIRARPSFQNHTPWSWVLEASNDNVTYYVMGSGGKNDANWAASEEEVWTLDGTFETHHGRIGFSNSDSTYQFYGQDFTTPVDMTITDVVMRSMTSGRNWSGGLFKLNASDEVSEVSATFSGTPSTSAWTTFTLSTPVSLNAGDSFLVGVRDTVNTIVRLNYISSGDVYGLLTKKSTGWRKTADALPIVGETKDATGINNGYTVYPKGTYVRGGP